MSPVLIVYNCYLCLPILDSCSIESATICLPILDSCSIELATLMQSSALGISSWMKMKSLHLRVRVPPAPCSFFSTLSTALCSNWKTKYKEGRKEMFYLMTHTTHYILRLYGVRHMVKDHSDSERGNPLPPHGLLFSINSKGSFIYTIPQTG